MTGKARFQTFCDPGHSTQVYSPSGECRKPSKRTQKALHSTQSYEYNTLDTYGNMWLFILQHVATATRHPKMGLSEMHRPRQAQSPDQLSTPLQGSTTSLRDLWYVATGYNKSRQSVGSCFENLIKYLYIYKLISLIYIYICMCVYVYMWYINSIK